MNIAEHVITKCGQGSRTDGVKAIAVWVNRTTKTVYCWAYPRTRGGTDGLIPADLQPTILRCARAAGIDLKPEDFFGLTELPALGVPANDNAAFAAAIPDSAPCDAVNDTLTDPAMVNNANRQAVFAGALPGDASPNPDPTQEEIHHGPTA
jgi:hypothetical protein